MKNQVDLIAEAMRAGQPPWRAGMFPVNPWTLNPYNGMNSMILNCVALRRGYKSKYWATYRQWGWLNLKVKKRPNDIPEGQWATKIVVPQTEVRLVANLFNAEQVFGRENKWEAAAPEQIPVSSVHFADRDGSPEKCRLIVEIANGFDGQPIDPEYDKYLPLWLKAMSDDPSFFTDCLEKAIKLGAK